MKAKLVVVGGDAKTREVKLKFPTVIGRGRSATLTLPHPLVSREHCEITEANDQLMVRDLGSLNGTYIGNARIPERGTAVLAAGELLTIGTVTFRAVYGQVVNDEVATVTPGDHTPMDDAYGEDSGEVEDDFEYVYVDEDDLDQLDKQAIEDKQATEEANTIDKSQTEEGGDTDIPELPPPAVVNTNETIPGPLSAPVVGPHVDTLPAPGFKEQTNPETTESGSTEALPPQKTDEDEDEALGDFLTGHS